MFPVYLSVVSTSRKEEEVLGFSVVSLSAEGFRVARAHEGGMRMFGGGVRGMHMRKVVGGDFGVFIAGILLLDVAHIVEAVRKRKSCQQECLSYLDLIARDARRYAHLH